MDKWYKISTKSLGIDSAARVFDKNGMLESFCNAISEPKKYDYQYNLPNIQQNIIYLFTFLKFYVENNTNNSFDMNIFNSKIAKRINEAGVLRALVRIDERFTKYHAKFLLNIFSHTEANTINQILQKVGVLPDVITYQSMEIGTEVVVYQKCDFISNSMGINYQTKYVNPMPFEYLQILVDCIDGDLSALNLHGMLWKSIVFKYCDFRGSALNYSNFENCDFEETEFDNCDLSFSVIENCSFDHCDLRGIRLKSSNFMDSRIRHSLLNLFSLEDTQLLIRVHSVKLYLTNIIDFSSDKIVLYPTHVIDSIETISDKKTKNIFVQQFFTLALEKRLLYIVYAPIFIADENRRNKLLNGHLLEILLKLKAIEHEHFLALMPTLRGFDSYLLNLEKYYLERDMQKFFQDNKDTFLTIIRKFNCYVNKNLYPNIVKFLVISSTFQNITLILGLRKNLVVDVLRSIINKLYLLNLQDPDCGISYTKNTSLFNVLALCCKKYI